MKLRTLIIDDEPIALEKLKSYVSKVPFLELVGAYASGLEAVGVLASQQVDLVFTDIQMPDLNGLELVESLSKAPMVVFATAYADYAVDSYRLSAVDYLLKPYGFADFQRAADRAMERFARISKTQNEEKKPVEQSADSLFIKVDYRYIRVDQNSIRYIKGYGEYLQIYLKDSATPMLTLSSFSAVRDKLMPSFLQVHRSYIVNLNCVEQIVRGRIVMDADTYIPVGDSYRQALQYYLQHHSVGSASKKSEA